MPRLNLIELDRELRNKNVAPVYFIYGPEGYLIDTTVKRIREFVLKFNETEFEPDRFSCKSASIEEIISCAQTMPMWVKLKLVIASEADSVKDGDAIEKYLKNPSKSTCLIFVAEKGDARTTFFKLCDKYATLIECKTIYDDKVPDWIRMELSSLKKGISIEAAQMILELVGNNLGEIKNALDRILLYIGNKNAIEASDVETVLTETGRKNIFEFTNAVGSRDLKKAIHILHRLLDFNESEVMIVSMLARHFRLLFKTRELIGGRPARLACEAQTRVAGGGFVDKFTAAKSVGVNPFFMEEYITQAKLFTPKELKSGFGVLYQTDKRLKSSKINKSSILDNCVRQLIHP